MKPQIKPSFRGLALCLLSATALSASALTPTESSSVLYMKQEEKLARDVYQALATRWEHSAFRNIAKAEQQHMNAVDGLILRFGLTDTTPAEPGRFSIPELQKLHDGLLAQGSLSLEAALRVGLAIEEADIADLKEALGLTHEPMLLRVFGNLMRASGQHLATFQAALGNGTATSTASTGCGLGNCPAKTDGTCPAAGTGKAPRGRNGMNAANGLRNGTTCGAACDTQNCPQGGVCPAGSCDEACPLRERPSAPRAGAPVSKGRR